MALHVPKGNMQNMMKQGAAHEEEAVFKNITACKEISQIVRTSFGPNGMNKMIINHLDKLFVTNDAATIIRELEVQHPAAKLLIYASQQQEHEVGDGTNFVIMFAGKLLEKASALLHMGLSPAEVIQGFEQAAEKAFEVLPELVCSSVKSYRDEKEVAKALKTPIGSKQWGNEDFIASLVAQACVKIAPADDKPFNVDNIRVCKIVGCGVLSSSVLVGMVFKRIVDTSVTTVENAKVAIYTAAIDSTHTETKGTVLIKTAAELKTFTKGEEDLLEGQIKALSDAGINVVVTSGKIGDMARHFLNKYKMMGVKLTSKFELQRLCRTVGATPLPRLIAPAPNEIGHCDLVNLQELGDTTVCVFTQTAEHSKVATIIVRGSTGNIMDDIERAIDDGVNSYKTITKDQRFVPGAGATDIELAHQLSQYGETCSGLEQYAITAFAEALEVVPHTLAENAGLKAQETVSKMYAAHSGEGEGKGKNMGVDIEGTGDLLDASASGIVDLYSVKYWGIKYATQAACTVLRVDQIIMAKQAGGPKAPKQAQYDED